MERKSQVQIPKDLLLALFQYHFAGNEEYLPEIEKALMEKLDSKGMFGTIVQGYLKKGYNRSTAEMIARECFRYES